MARALNLARLLSCLLVATGCQAAWALGPMAPFTPPAPTQAASEAAPALEQINSVGLTGIKLGRQPHALIDGSWVTQGAKVREDAVLIAIERYAVRLKHPDGKVERLSLSPDVEMTRSSRHALTPRRMP